MAAPNKSIRIGSRTSKLALVQTNHVAQLLRNKHADWQVEVVEFSTKGDRVLDVALSKIGDKGLFTQELEDALLSGQIDMAVHSLKDMPTQLPSGLCLGAISAREAVSDVVIFSAHHRAAGIKSLDELPVGSCIGTSSLRRIAQLQEKYNHGRGELSKQFEFRSVRGNLQTRLSKLDNHADFGYDAIILAEAGLRRLELFDRVHEVLDCNTILPAVGQGALAVECRSNDEATLAILKEAVHHHETAVCCEAERAFLRTLEGGCQVPVGAFTRLNGSELTILGVVASEDGRTVFRGSMTGDLSAELGVLLANQLKAEGCESVLIQR